MDPSRLTRGRPARPPHAPSARRTRVGPGGHPATAFPHRHPGAAPTPRSNPLAPWQRRGVYGCLALLTVSGGLWLAAHFLGWPVPAPMEGLPSPWEPGLMKLHGALAMLALFLVGSVAGGHVARGWRQRRRRASGVAVLALGVLAVLGGYLLYYWAPEAWRDGIGLVHAATGVAMAGLLLAHRRR